MTSRIFSTAVFAAAVILLPSCKKEKAVTTTSTAPPPATVPATPPPPAVISPEAIVSSDRAIPAEGLQMWLRPEIGTNSGAGGVVSAWHSPNNIFATQNDPVRRPVFVLDAAGKQPAIRFDGIDDSLETNLDINPSVAGNLTVIAVFRSGTAEKTQPRKLYSHDDGGSDRAAGIENYPDHNFGIQAGDHGPLGTFDIAASTWYIAVDSYQGAQYTGWINGHETVRNQDARHGQGTTSMFLGSGAGAPEPWLGEIGDVLVYNRPLPAAQRSAIERSLAKKYGIKL